MISILHYRIDCGPKFTGTESSSFQINDSRFDGSTWVLRVESVTPGQTVQVFDGQYNSFIPASASKVVTFTDVETGDYTGFFFIDANNQALGIATVAAENRNGVISARMYWGSEPGPK